MRLANSMSPPVKLNICSCSAPCSVSSMKFTTTCGGVTSNVCLNTNKYENSASVVVKARRCTVTFFCGFTPCLVVTPLTPMDSTSPLCGMLSFFTSPSASGGISKRSFRSKGLRFDLTRSVATVLLDLRALRLVRSSGSFSLPTPMSVFAALAALPSLF